MHPVELVRGFLVDLWRMPLMFQLFLLYGAGVAGWQWWKRREESAMMAESAGWPVYRARVVSAQVSEEHSRRDGGYWEAVLTYSYTVPGHELEVGEHRKQFYDSAAAGEWARGLRDGFVEVRVDPENSKRSLWMEDALELSRFAAVGEGDHDNVREEGVGVREIAAGAVGLIAGCGALLSAWLQIMAISGRPAPVPSGGARFFGMQIGAIGCAIASAALDRNLTRQWKREKSVFGNWNASDGKLVKWVGVYAGVVFVYGWVRSAAGDKGSMGYMPLMFSAVWLVFFLTSAIACWRVLRGETRASG